MKKKIIWLLIIVTCLFVLGCSDFFSSSGNDDENTILWTKEQSPIYIEGCYVVPEGKTLMIQPGVEVRFKGTRYGDDYNDLESGMLHVKGTIIARGTKNDSIKFISDSDEYRWTIICIDSTSTENNIFQYCKIMHSGKLKNLYRTCDYIFYRGGDIGAIFFYKSTGTVKDCYFNNNICGTFFYCSSTTKIKNNSFIDNEFDVYCEELSTPVIESNTFIDNHVVCDSWDTSILFNKSSPKIINNHITGYVLAIRGNTSGNPEVIGNTIERNSIGIVYYENIQGIIEGNILTRHQYPIACGDGSSPFISNNLIIKNQSGISCGGNANPYILNNTITNTGYPKETYRGISCGESSSPEICNTIINGFRYNLYVCDESCHPTIAYSFIQSDTLPVGFIDGGNNILGASLDPLFVDEENNDCQLQSDSPCVNAGYNNAPNLPETDILGNPRISGPAVDIGAYEYQESGKYEKAVYPRSLNKSGRIYKRERFTSFFRDNKGDFDVPISGKEHQSISRH